MEITMAISTDTQNERTRVLAILTQCKTTEDFNTAIMAIRQGIAAANFTTPVKPNDLYAYQANPTGN